MEIFGTFGAILTVSLVLTAVLPTETVFTIERRVTRKTTLPYPSADKFANPSRNFLGFCSSSGCSVRGAKCSGRLFSSTRCCVCECRGHVPNFYSVGKGCLRIPTLLRTEGASCFFNLQGSGSSYIPTLTSYTDIESGKIILQPKFPSLAEVLVEGLCKATTIYYYNRQGRKIKLIDNYCSEVISLKKRVTEDGETQHVFVWEWKHDPNTIWRKLQGKLLSMDITCKARRVASHCLLFKVGGSYNDDANENTVESPKTCPSKKSPSSTKITTTVLKRTTKLRTTSLTSTTGTQSIVTTTKSVIQPPASLPDTKSTAVPDSHSSGSPLVPDSPPIPVAQASTRKPRTPSTETREGQRGSSKGKQSDTGSKHNVNWLVTGLIIAVAVLFIILAASLSVLVRKRCKKKASGRNISMMTNVLYHNGTQGPHYEEAKIIPPRPTCQADDDVVKKGFDDCNLYESIDNIDLVGLKGASALTYDYATADAKVELPEKKDNNEQLTVPRRRAAMNKYDVPGQSRPKADQPSAMADLTPEEYADMSQGSFSESSPLCPTGAAKEYENIDDDDNVDTSLPIRDEVYEDMGLIPEQAPLVPERYVEPAKFVA
ncbi:uncharacterized protein LOC135692786 [Rhopilema esculentum]|uniref:uncharacterized protein LOC135692786 n=1 Tax=Rhopilema esculentum TaxID=499914 RepID=UPI0031DAAA20